MSPRDGDLRAAMMYKDGRVMLERLNHPACEGMVLDLYEEGLQIAVDKGRIAPTFVTFMHNVARTCLNEQNLPERRTLGCDPDRANRGGATLRMDTPEVAYLFDPILHPDFLSVGTEAGQDPPPGCAQRQIRTATVPNVWMTPDFPRAPPGSKYTYAGVTSFPEEQFDRNVVGDDPPGKGPSGTSGDCPHNFISVY